LARLEIQVAVLDFRRRAGVEFDRSIAGDDEIDRRLVVGSLLRPPRFGIEAVARPREGIDETSVAGVYLEVQVGSGRVAGAAHDAQKLAGLDPFADALGRQRRGLEMAVPRHRSV